LRCVQRPSISLSGSKREGARGMAETKTDTSPNPLDKARRLSAPVLQKRFYSTVEMRVEEGAFVLRLDGRRAVTPARNPLAVPGYRLAEAIAAEWEAQRETIDPATMPATRLANSAIDGVAPRLAEVRGTVLAYAGTDLLCYRAEEPEGLAARQRALWDPILAWAEERYAIRFALAGGVIHVAQPEPTLKALAAALERYDEPFRLAGLQLATTLTGSALIALALAEGAVSVDEAWAAAHVDEDWNIAQWGEDAEAARRRAQRLEDFRAAALALGR
jgi:chaperone required for assembly of F1-ATPase